MTYERLKQRLDAGEVVILDGATGTELQRRGLPMDPAAWCGPTTLENDAILRQIHADYIAAGAEVVIAGSLSHMVPVADGTDAVDPDQLPDDAEIAAAFEELAQILAAAGCELILLEMMYHPGRSRLALEAALATGLPVWFGASARRGKDGRVVSFHLDEDLPLDAITSLIPAQGVDAAGVMHSGAELVAEALASLRRHFKGPLMAYPDSGYFEMPNWRFVDVITPQRFEAFCRDWLAAGVQILGGCCGLTVAHIEAAVRARDRAA